MELAQLAAVGQLHGLLEIGHAAALRAGLEDAAGSLDRVVQSLAQVDGQAARLLAVDVLAGLRGQHRRGRMPTIARGDQHRVDVLAGEQFAEVAIELAVLVAVVFVDQSLAGIAATRLHVGNGDAPYVAQTEHRRQVIGAAGTDSDHAEHNGLARRNTAILSQDVCGHDGRQSKCGTGHCRLTQKIPARGLVAHFHHLLLLLKPVGSSYELGSHRSQARPSPWLLM